MLFGVRVIEFCKVAAGPYCGMLLADMGADVVKVESPVGDDLRHWPPLRDGFSENFASLNRNKRSIVLDLKSAHGKTAAIELCRRADVVIENNRPGVMKRLGLDYETVSKNNKRLIYCSISAFGQSGPRATQGGFDLTLQGISGIMSVTGDPDGAPVKCGVPISDFAAGLYAAFSVASALQKVHSTGFGSHIDVSMLGASLGIAALQTSEYFGTGRNPRPLGSAHPRNAPYQAFKAKDGYFVLAAGNDRLWRAVCEAIGRQDIAEDLRFESTALRARNQEALTVLLEAEFSKSTCDELIQRFQEANVPSGPINGYAEILSDPQIEQSGWIKEIDLPTGTRVRTFGPPVRFDGESGPIRRAPPALGEHTNEILAEVGISSLGGPTESS